MSFLLLIQEPSSSKGDNSDKVRNDASQQQRGDEDDERTRAATLDDVFIQDGVHNGRTKSRGVYYSRRPGDGRLKFDDSFYKRATVQQRVDSQDQPDPDGVTDIFIPVPGQASHDSTINETMSITSVYETNMSINKLFRERHKGSLAAMGRLFGSKQKELNTQKEAARLVSEYYYYLHHHPDNRDCIGLMRRLETFFFHFVAVLFSLKTSLYKSSYCILISIFRLKAPRSLRRDCAIVFGLFMYV